MPPARFLVVPCLEPGRGGGHLSRCLALVSALRRQGREAMLCAPAPLAAGLSARIAALDDGFDPMWILNYEGCAPRPAPSAAPAGVLVILDRFATPPREFRAWAALGPVAGIDEGGPCRAAFDFLIDLLPALPGRRPANLSAPRLLPLPMRRRASFAERASPGGPLRVLLSFGAEDAAGMGAAVMEALAPLAGTRVILEQARGVPRLKERLADYDLLITHFGLSAFEALYARVPVLLLSPTRYHEALSRAAGFISAGRGPHAALRLRALISDDAVAERCAALAARWHLEDEAPRDGLAALFLQAEAPRAPRACPCCGAVWGSKVRPGRVYHVHDRGYRRCPVCGTFAMLRLDRAPVTYDKEYFFGRYQAQYGKTYLEDFPALRAAARRRIAVLSTLTGGSLRGRRVLDIGCAYGAFLAEAKDAGALCEGLEPIGDAAAYVRKTLGIPCAEGFFPPSPPLAPASFDVVTLWYVIEHFEDPAAVLREARRLLKPGGILAFATPSASGISARASLIAFLEKSPPDHWTIWRPARCRALLKRHGFRLKRVVITGHHPERFPLAGKRDGPWRRLLGLASRLFRLGDTFEVYAVTTVNELKKSGGGP